MGRGRRSRDREHVFFLLQELRAVSVNKHTHTHTGLSFLEDTSFPSVYSPATFYVTSSLLLLLLLTPSSSSNLWIFQQTEKQQLTPSLPKSIVLNGARTQAHTHTHAGAF